MPLRLPSRLPSQSQDVRSSDRSGQLRPAPVGATAAAAREAPSAVGEVRLNRLHALTVEAAPMAFRHGRIINNVPDPDLDCRVHARLAECRTAADIWCGHTAAETEGNQAEPVRCPLRVWRRLTGFGSAAAEVSLNAGADPSRRSDLRRAWLGSPRAQAEHGGRTRFADRTAPAAASRVSLRQSRARPTRPQ